MKRCPGFVIGAASSGSGKTSIALGLTRALLKRGLRVQPFKVGPDFLDPTHLRSAANRTCFNLDGWMTSRSYCEQLFEQQMRDADIAVVEGVMGLFDGSDPSTNESSTAEMATWLDLPVLLVVDAHGTSRTFAAIVQGIVEFDPDVQFLGVIANRVGSERHRQWLAEALASKNLPPLVGAIPRDAFPTLPGRHLGLHQASELEDQHGTIEKLALACEEFLDLDLLPEGEKCEAAKSPLPAQKASANLRLGVASDEAFSFCYPDNLTALEEKGVEVIPFSPLHDSSLPENLNALYLPGGYPELHAATLASNASMLSALDAFARSGRFVYAECGGMIYLGEKIILHDGQEFPFTGVLPIVAKMQEKRKMLGYVDVTIEQLGGIMLRGHEFHYSQIIEDRSRESDWKPAYTLQRRRSQQLEASGFQSGNVLAGYPHLHWADSPSFIDFFLRKMQEKETQ